MRRVACALNEGIGPFPKIQISRSYVSDSGLHPSPRCTRYFSFRPCGFSHFTTGRLTIPYPERPQRLRRLPLRPATIARLPILISSFVAWFCQELSAPDILNILFVRGCGILTVPLRFPTLNRFLTRHPYSDTLNRLTSTACEPWPLNRDCCGHNVRSISNWPSTSKRVG